MAQALRLDQFYQFKVLGYVKMILQVIHSISTMLFIIWQSGKVLYRKTLGRPATLGMLYSAHSDNFIPGFGFWEENDIKENKQIVCHGSAKTTLAYDQTRDQKRFLLDVKAELEISVKANIPIEVWGSAGYLKHEEVFNN